MNANKMSTKKRWVTPSFGCTSSSDEPAKKCTTSRKRPARFTGSTKAYTPIEHKTLTWLEKYQPEIPDDLVIHPKKVKEVEDWFHNYMTYDNEKYLILNGPCGCGKTSTLRVLAKHFNFQIIEWITPLDRDYDPEVQDPDQFYQKASTVFDQFLAQATRYPSLFTATTYKLILVKDFPNVFIQNPETLHTMIRKYLHVNTNPIVFVCNDDHLSRNLFPEKVRKECSMRVINFNPVTCKAVVKALQRVLELERRSNPNVNIHPDINLEHIYESSTGDLRSAILKLHFVAVRGSAELPPVHKASGGAPKVKDKDETSDLFKILGRVLYSSRKASDKHGYSFLHEPADIVDSVTMQPSTFVAFLQENYVSRFANIEDVSMAANALSYADVLLMQHYKERLCEVAMTLVTRGLMVANNNPVKSFKPFVRPRFRENISVTVLCDEVRDRFGTFEHSPHDIILYTIPLLSKTNYSFDGEEQKGVVTKLTDVFRCK